MNVPYLIIGAGPTGLGAAWRLDGRGVHDWLLLEGGLVPGGLARSVVDDHGFTWDLGGHVQFAFNNAVVVLPHLQSGKLRAIAVATAQRVPNLPEVPTIAESGLPGYEGLLFYALVAPARTPPAIVNKLNEAVRQTNQNPDVKQQFSRLGAISVDMTPDELGAFLKRELAKWTKVIAAGNIQPD